MNKIPLPVFLMACAGVASAQSSVTLFGIVDTSISSYSTKSTLYGVAAATPSALRPSTATASQKVLSSGNFLPSRLGFRGTEDLGGGLAAGFWLEAPLSTDDGATPVVFSRRSTVSLTGPLGELRLGRDYTPTFWVDTLFDPMNNIGVGANTIGAVNARLAGAAALSGGGLFNTLPGGAADGYARTSNSIGYFLPPDLGGVYGQLMYALPETLKVSGVPGSPSQRGALYGARFGYASGPLNIAGSYVQNTAVDAVAPFTGPLRERRIKTANLGGSYDFNVLKLFGELSHVNDESMTALGGGPLTTRASPSYDGAMVGLTVPFGASMIRSSYALVKYRSATSTAFPANQNATTSKFAIGYVYNLSKRTLLYATAAYIRIKDGETNPVMAVAPGNSISYVTTGGYAPRSARGYDFGISHSF